MLNVAVGSRLLDSVVWSIIIFKFFSKTTGWIIDCSTTKKGHDGRMQFCKAMKQITGGEVCYIAGME